jgi:hypothetical protein
MLSEKLAWANLDAAEIQRGVMAGERPATGEAEQDAGDHKELRTQLVTVMRSSWQQDGASRPSMAVVRATLLGLLDASRPSLQSRLRSSFGMELFIP